MGLWWYLSDGQFLLGHITRHINHLHPVSERLWDGVNHIGRADKQNLDWSRQKRADLTKTGCICHFSLELWNHTEQMLLPLTDLQEHPGSGRGSWHSVQGPEAPAMRRMDRPGNHDPFYPPDNRKIEEDALSLTPSVSSSHFLHLSKATVTEALRATSP